ncbi:acyl-CoA reductase [Alteromonas gilva]|uniref:Acyl-CoA reductase n=1 Tax=Alteromonas gilva TaxID=2987522 RepID=A0ABT5L246_9ALTE|nr:acyl-CoA reductase [Alteromonas gilva]MDC8830466.1 acyl-CoA reductase [Alteromonas gilva]
MDSKPVPGATELCEAVGGFSDFLFKQSTLRRYPEIVALAFWFRTANLKHIRNRLAPDDASKTVQRVFHIAPANVDTVFVYSLLLSVLSGNCNTVRVSERSGEVTWILIDMLNQYLDTQRGTLLKALICVVEYPAQHQAVTEQLSNWCDLRVVWGGDDAIKAISEIAPHTHQISFPNRYSVAVINATQQSDVAIHARALLADVLPFNQQACSSPKAIYWLNTQPALQEQFWREVATQLPTTNHQLSVGNKVGQHTDLQYLAASQGLKLAEEFADKSAFARIASVGPLGRCKVSEITSAMLEVHAGNGLILEQDIQSMNDIAYSTKLQTVSCTGTDTGIAPTGEHKRIVPLGKALEFNEVWDGVDLLKEFY